MRKTEKTGFALEAKLVAAAELESEEVARKKRKRKREQDEAAAQRRRCDQGRHALARMKDAMCIFHHPPHKV